jgi:hypothetical protein
MSAADRLVAVPRWPRLREGPRLVILVPALLILTWGVICVAFALWVLMLGRKVE